LCNTILVQSNVANEVGSSAWFDVTQNCRTARSVALVEFRGCLVANLHLCGGRYDDQEYKRTKHAKARQIWAITSLSHERFGRIPDIVAGDLNSERSSSEALVTLSKYPIYRDAPDKGEFLEWYLSGHEALDIHRYRPAYSERQVRPTSVYGGDPDWVYVRNPYRAVGAPVVVWGPNDGHPPLSDHAAVCVWIERSTTFDSRRG
jgi:hypothetical protein